MSAIYGNVVGASSTLGKSVVIKGTDGTELVGVVTDTEKVFTATPNDIRKGKIAATEDGIIEGQKDIPAYRTTMGTRMILPGSDFTIPLKSYEQYDYTKLQCIITPFDGSLANSVLVEKTIINDNVFAVGSKEILSTVTKNKDTQSIDLNIINNSDKRYIIRYFTYREEE